MDIYELIESKRDEILALADRFGMENIRIFGSVARREEHEKSDIDFLVKFPPGAGLLSHAAFKRELSELLGRDVASENGLKEKIRLVVLREALPL